MSYTQNKSTLKLIKYLSMTSFYWGVCITLFGALGLFTGKEAGNTGQVIMGLVFIGVIPGIVGYLLKRHADKYLKNLDSSAIDRQALLLAKKRRGRLILSEAMLELNLPQEKAKELLDGFVIKGMAEVEVTDDGVLVYVFRELKKIRM